MYADLFPNLVEVGRNPRRQSLPKPINYVNNGSTYPRRVTYLQTGSRTFRRETVRHEKKLNQTELNLTFFLKAKCPTAKIPSSLLFVIENKIKIWTHTRACFEKF